MLTPIYTDLSGNINRLSALGRLHGRYGVEESVRQGVAVISAKNHKRQRSTRQSVTDKREKSQTPKVLTAILTLPNLT